MRKVHARIVSAACAVVVGLTLSGCQSKGGAAAVVDGRRISESDLADYVDAQAKDATQGRQFALIFLVKEKLYEQVLGPRGGVPAPAALAAYHDDAVTNLLSDQLGTGAAADTAIGQVLADRGLSSAMVPIIVRASELEWAAYQRLKVAPAAFFPAVAALQIPVSVSPRYGSWNPKTQDLGDRVIPSFLTISPTQAPSAVPTAVTTP